VGRARRVLRRLPQPTQRGGAADWRAGGGSGDGPEVEEGKKILIFKKLLEHFEKILQHFHEKCCKMLTKRFGKILVFS
jgi:hypothetical protein